MLGFLCRHRDYPGDAQDGRRKRYTLYSSQQISVLSDEGFCTCRQYGFDLHENYNRLLLDGRFHDVVKQEQPHVAPFLQQPMRHTLKKGDVWLQDPRIFHRGTANVTDAPRPEMQISYRHKSSPSPYRGLFVNNGYARHFTPGELAGLELSERGEHDPPAVF